MTKMNKRSLIALLVSLALVLSFFTVSVLADETTTEETTVATEETTTAKSEQTTTAKTESTTTAATTTEHSHEIDWKNVIITGSIVLVILVIAGIIAYKNRVKLVAFLRSVKSEMKKIVWSPKDQTRKNYLVVMVICIAIVILIGVLDFAFNKGITKLTEIIKTFKA